MHVRLFGCCNVPERERVNRCAARHQVTGIDGDLAATAASEDSSFVAGSELLVDGGMCSV
jgi:hypothetical protein